MRIIIYLIKVADPPCEGLSQDGKITAASSVTVFVVASVLFFTVGFLCGHFRQKMKANNQTIPLYDTVHPKQYEQELQMKENVAYGPVHV